MKGNNSLFSAVGNPKFRFGLNIQLFAKMPKNDAQIKHIMADREGHIKDTPENRRLLEDVTNDKKNFVGKDFRGHEWYSKITDNGQIWVHVYEDRIINGGINRKYVPYTENNGIKKKIVRRQK